MIERCWNNRGGEIMAKKKKIEVEKTREMEKNKEMNDTWSSKIKAICTLSQEKHTSLSSSPT